MKLRSCLVPACLLLLSLSGTADAQLFGQAIPGATCAPDNTLPAASIHEYQGQALVNTGTSTWDFFVAKCAISEFTRGMKGREYRVIFDGDAEIAWCVTYDAYGQQVHFGGVSPVGSRWFYYGPGSSHRWQYNFTTYCLMPPGTELERLTLIWEQE